MTKSDQKCFGKKTFGKKTLQLNTNPEHKETLIELKEKSNILSILNYNS